ncbi:MAG: helix-turn-helix domain-containing protein [Ferruginibacter sp.]
MDLFDSFQLASDFIRYTHTSIFLTGKAGTGKTTFLKYCKENSVKNTAVVAPTGVAALNAGGTTIHSFFQLPFTPYLPTINRFDSSNDVNDRNDLVSHLRLTSERREVMQKLELLIIDEIGMVRCDILDAIDTVLRHVRSQHSRAFGGVQLLLIGDMYQLPPVVKDNEWQILSPFYKSPYFFSSHVIENQPPVYVELEKIYRQNDHLFVNVLNQVRNNEMDQDGFNTLHSRYLPYFTPADTENYITLTTHNNKADTINYKALNDLEGKLYQFNALIEGEFYEKSFPADLQLKLKVGAQVMFIKNDTEKIRRYFNGKIGIIEKIDNDKIMVLCDGITSSIEVKKEKWRNIKYTLDKTTNQLVETEIGSFTQFPLRLAWAITIHKSQGLTFERAIIDAGEAFAPGQVYVALSRCTSLEGMVLHSRVNDRSLHNDPRIISFAGTQRTSARQLQLLQNAKLLFQKEEILLLFNFSQLLLSAKALLSFTEEHQNSFNKETLPWVTLLVRLIETVVITSTKFAPQLEHLLHLTPIPESNEALQIRLIAASRHFIVELEKIKKYANDCTSQTVSRSASGNFNKFLSKINDQVCEAIHLLNGCQDGFVVEMYLQHKRLFVKPAFTCNAYAGKPTYHSDGPHPELYKLLCKKRDLICEEKNIAFYLVAGSITLEEMTVYLPQTPTELMQISGFGPAKSRQFGDDFLALIREYCDQHNLSTHYETKPIQLKRSGKKVAVTGDSKLFSLHLFKEGKTIEEIAIERNMVTGTIEKHLLYFVQIGKMGIDAIVSADNQQLIKAARQKFGAMGNKAIKENLPAHISYGEIKMMAAAEKLL